jgi:broad specificity phosphatase PhoE
LFEILRHPWRKKHNREDIVIIYIIRHGEKKDGDYFNRKIGQNDQPINENGIKQSKQLVEYFKDKNIERVYISEYLRTEQTIQYVCEDKKIKTKKSSLLNEINGGQYFRITEEEQKQNYPLIYNKLLERKNDFKYPEGESGKDVLERIKRIFKVLEYDKKDAILVSHEGWIKIAICYLLGLEAGKRFQFFVNTGSITEIEYFKEQKYWQIKRFNQILYDK